MSRSTEIETEITISQTVAVSPSVLAVATDSVIYKIELGTLPQICSLPNISNTKQLFHSNNHIPYILIVSFCLKFNPCQF